MIFCYISKTFWILVRVKIDLEYLSSSAASYEKMVTHLKAYMHYKRFPQQLQRRVLTYYEFRFQKSYFRESEILHVLCGQLRQVSRAIVHKVLT